MTDNVPTTSRKLFLKQAHDDDGRATGPCTITCPECIAEPESVDPHDYHRRPRCSNMNCKNCNDEQAERVRIAKSLIVRMVAGVGPYDISVGRRIWMIEATGNESFRA